ncbi:hypothetical protein PSI15_13470 [Xenorhabdus sp. PR6a]|uniref:hypothetical protein n=1 Tax=Xenorhabdus TaxID=626 RepID=UPI0019A1B014|nr:MULTISPECIES: hypothetical protein [unclassified Xenorhabdus]MBD2798116.1 hypothetical protein [Xenorhabdus sp. 18]MDC9582560.1 hypothetical protein [Xenorhabdus sp. PR6a]
MAPLTKNQLKKISDLYQKISSLKHLPNTMESDIKANDDEVYELRFNPSKADSYILINMENKMETIPNGLYVFVNRIDEPGVIRMADFLDQHGHSSLTYYKTIYDEYHNIAVYYAGMAEFTSGKLMYWNNLSGHYKPPFNLHENFIPYINRLFPKHLFKNHDTYR